jgi:hypothetical protein
LPSFLLPGLLDRKAEMVTALAFLGTCLSAIFPHLRASPHSQLLSYGEVRWLPCSLHSWAFLEFYMWRWCCHWPHGSCLPCEGFSCLSEGIWVGIAS